MSILTNEELELLDQVQSSAQWGQACDQIKRNHGGQYPNDWWTTMKLSGKMDEILGRFGEDSRISLNGVKVGD